jgi:hypothetical protein
MTERQGGQRVRWAAAVAAIVVLLALILFFVYGGATRPQLAAVDQPPTVTTA